MSRPFGEQLRLELVRRALGVSADAPTVFDERFEVLGQPRQGGMSRVYRVRDRSLERVVALKTVARRRPEDERRIRHEFRVRAGLSHRNLLRLHELFVREGRCYFTMEYLEDAVTLLEWVGGGQTPDNSDMSEGAGVDVSPARAPAYDRRLRCALHQLALGLHALHEYGKVHRDVKPDNALVTPDGRVVLLDFGLAAARADRAGGGEGARAEVAGTSAYIAPEQARGGPCTPAVDLYALGVILYQGLTGRLPFSGGPASILERKRVTSPPAPATVARDVPQDLDALAVSLLARRPERRPQLPEVLARLAAPADDPQVQASRSAARSVVSRRGHPFVGRARELASLQAALDELLRARGFVSRCVLGPSGIGKSSLVRTFLAGHDEDERAGEVLILRGRCSPRERVPYNAWDAVVDGLARALARLPGALQDDARDDEGALGSTRAEDRAALLQLFPALAQIEALAGVDPGADVDEARAEGAAVDAIELRQRGFAALRALLRWTARRFTLILWIDDAQWADRDSAALLEAVLREPAPPLLLLASAATESGERGRLLELLLRADADRALRLGPLATDTLARLAAAALDSFARDAPIEGARGPDAQQVDAIARHAEGDPFVALECARLLAGAGPAALARLSGDAGLELGRVLERRIEELTLEQRAIVETVAVAVRELDPDLALEAAELPRSARPLFAELCDDALLRWSASDADPRVGVYHRRLREAVLAGTAPERRARRHLGLGRAIERRTPDDHDALLVHWEAGGERLRAGRHAVLAAERAASTLAFERAGALYEKALELLAREADRPALLERLAETLVNRGRGGDAARRYLEAARALPGSDGAAAARARSLRRRAAEQYLKSGQLGEGWEVMRAVLAEVGVTIPRSHRRALAGAMRRRVGFMLQRRVPAWLTRRAGAGSRPLTRAEVSRHEVLWSASTSLALVNYSLADDLRTRLLLEADKSPDPSTRCRALAYEAAMQAFVDRRRLARSIERLLTEVDGLARARDDPYDRAWHQLAQAIVSLTAGRWAAARACGLRAETIFAERCVGAYWERATASVYVNTALVMLGELARLRARVVAMHEDAARRGDIFTVIGSHSGEMALAWLADGRGALARARVQRALARIEGSVGWPDDRFQTWRYAELLARVHTELYDGAPWRAWDAVLELWSNLQAAMMLRLELVRVELRSARARAALALLIHLEAERAGGERRGRARAPRRGASWTARRLRADLRAQIVALDRDPAPYAAPYAALARAGLARADGRDERAAALLGRARDRFEGQEMTLMANIARLALVEVGSGSFALEGAARARVWLTEEQGIEDPEAMLAALAPGFGRARAPRRGATRARLEERV